MSVLRTRKTGTFLIRIFLTDVLTDAGQLLGRIGRTLGRSGKVGCDGHEIFLRLNIDGLELPEMIAASIRVISEDVRIVSYTCTRIPDENFDGFSVVTGDLRQLRRPSIIPDLSICPYCKEEITDPHNRRYGYPFTSCSACGPASLTDHSAHCLGGERRTPCERCRAEAMDMGDRRYGHAGISCPDCGPAVYWQRRNTTRIQLPGLEILREAAAAILEGSILGIKGIGGYLLLCDATNEAVIHELRQRKSNHHVPLAVMYPSLSEAADELAIDEQHAAALMSPSAPIVICPFPATEMPLRIARNALAGRLDRLGVMLPHSPMLQLLAALCGRPIVVTSANTSGAPMIFREEERSELWQLADALMDHDLQIPIPQEEGVVQFTERGDRIIRRRGRGMATELPIMLPDVGLRNALAMGSNLGATFGWLHETEIHTSYPLGNLTHHKSAERLNSALDQLLHLRSSTPEVVILDGHAEGRANREGQRRARALGIPELYVRHHEAHFAAVLAEHGLLNRREAVLGVVWDHGAMGDDGQEWGSEFMSYQGQGFDRRFRLYDFPRPETEFGGRDPRLAAMALLRHRPDARRVIGHLFTPEEWRQHQGWVLKGNECLTGSMCRFIDGVAALLDVEPTCSLPQHWQGLAILESMAHSIEMVVSQPYEFNLRHGRIDWRPVIDTIIGDIDSGAAREMVASRFLYSLAGLVADIARKTGIRRIALSGDAFTSPLLVSLIGAALGPERTLYIHQQVAPTDECIALGQLALAGLRKPGTWNSDDVRERQDGGSVECND